MTAPGQWYGDPFVMGTAEDFSALRDMLERIEYTEESLCASAGVPDFDSWPDASSRDAHQFAPDSPATVMAHLFIEGSAVPFAQVERVLGPTDQAALRALGLIGPVRDDSTLCIATVALYPAERLWIASDRHNTLEHVSTAMPADIVFTAMSPETRRFVALMPRDVGGDSLDLCAGAGIAALVAARDFADRAYAVDIADRSTRFTAFNAALNGLTNVETLTGDLYAPLDGRTFDVITAHPPYVMSNETEFIYRDGGDLGEQITGRIFARLAEHLRPGGTFFCHCRLTEGDELPMEARVRTMLGPLDGEFDLLVGQERMLDAEPLVRKMISVGRFTEAAGMRHLEQLAERRMTRFVDAAFLLQRHRQPAKAVTRRRILSDMSRGADLQRVLADAIARTELAVHPDRVMAMTPICSPHTEVVSRSALRDGRWTIVESTLTTRVPFAVQADSPTWFATLLTWCDGRASGHELLTRLVDAGILPAAADDASFVSLLCQLADAGFVELRQPEGASGDVASA